MNRVPGTRAVVPWDRRWLLRFWPVLAIAAVCLLVALGGDEARLLGRYERGALEQGEWWRLLTAHLTHLGWGHLWLNLVGLALIAALLEDSLEPGEWLTICLAGAVGIDAALYWLHPGIEWYVGLSGVLHALLAAGAVQLLRRRAPTGVLLVAILVAKLGWEQSFGALPFSAEAAGPVIVEAHLYGALAGVAAVATTIAVRGTRRRPL